MNKKVTFWAILTLGICGIIALPTHAEEPTTSPINADEIDSQTTDQGETFTDGSADTTSNEAGIMPINDSPDEATNEPEMNNTDDLNTVIHEGIADEPEVVCADPTEPGCEDPSIKDEEDPALWPLIVSLSALGATVLIVVIINLFGRKKS